MEKYKYYSIKVPPVADLAAVKLGLPADYKNIFDAIVLLQQTSTIEVVSSIKNNDSWDEMVLSRLSRYRGRLQDKNSLVHRIALDADIDIKNIEKKLYEIYSMLGDEKLLLCYKEKFVDTLTTKKILIYRPEKPNNL